MDLYPGAYCTYQTTSSTKVIFNTTEANVYYYSYEGNNLPLIGVCKLVQSTKNYLQTDSSVLMTGLLGGILNGNCGYFVVI